MDIVIYGWETGVAGLTPVQQPVEAVEATVAGFTLLTRSLDQVRPTIH